MYSLIKPLLFRLDPERSHDVVMSTLGALSGSEMALRAMRVRRPKTRTRRASLMNLPVPSGVGLAAGLDKHGLAFPALRALGFGWVEIGTVTPRPQAGNDKPRLFRLERERALVNRMGFNSCGIERFIHNLSSRRQHYDSILGINIGKNAATPLDRADDDYLYALEMVYPHADYVAVNISSPNTRSLRELQHTDRLQSLIEALIRKRGSLHDDSGRRVPIALKLSPDLSDGEIGPMCALMRDLGIDGVIATNTTTSRPVDLTNRHGGQTGGLSGPPLEPIATAVVAALRRQLGDDMPIIGVGGVEDEPTVQRKLSAGAQAVQCYTSFIYQGPRLLERLTPSV